MSDKTMFIIVIWLNILMWFVVVSHMTNTNKRFSEINKRQSELSEKSIAYLHTAHEGLNTMTKMNVEAMGAFIQQISAIIESQQGKQDHAQKDRQ